MSTHGPITIGIAPPAGAPRIERIEFFDAATEALLLPPKHVDAPTDRCSFHAHNCTGMMIGHGGLQLHHEAPQFLGGNPHGTLLTLCPSHHVRQHALIRYLIECEHAGIRAATSVTVHFMRSERLAALVALSAWEAEAQPWPLPWSAPAAR